VVPIATNVSALPRLLSLIGFFGNSLPQVSANLVLGTWNPEFLDELAAFPHGRRHCAPRRWMVQ